MLALFLLSMKLITLEPVKHKDQETSKDKESLTLDKSYKLKVNFIINKHEKGGIKIKKHEKQR